MIKSAEKINFLYGHFFDEIIENNDLAEAFEKLCESVARAENEPLWAPASWVQWNNFYYKLQDQQYKIRKYNDRTVEHGTKLLQFSLWK